MGEFLEYRKEKLAWEEFRIRKRRFSFLKRDSVDVGGGQRQRRRGNEGEEKKKRETAMKRLA